jgi:glycosyltransferase involved in cell wall biosynthesis
MLYNLLRGLWLNDVAFDLVLSDKEKLDQAFRQELMEWKKPRIVTSGGTGPRFIAEQRMCFDSKLSGNATLFPNYFTPPLLPPRFGRVVTIIHDFQFRHFPQYTPRRKRLWLAAAHSGTFRRADVVVVLSDFVRRDAVRYHGDLARQKLVAIPNPIAWEHLEAGRAAASGAKPYILTVASQYPHKNLETLLRAFSLVRSRGVDVGLVVAGQHRSKLVGQMVGGDDLEDLASDLGLGEQVRFTGHIGNLDLAGLYRNASIFAFPSLFEGFGMPPVEAALSRRPVVVGGYPVAEELRALGFHWLAADDEVGLRAAIERPDTAVLDADRALARRHFSHASMRAALGRLVAEAGWPVP